MQYWIKMGKKQVWFWSEKLEISEGEIATWIYSLDPFSYNKPIASIRAYNGYSINLPQERLYETYEECLTGLRDKKLTELLY